MIRVPRKHFSKLSALCDEFSRLKDKDALLEALVRGSISITDASAAEVRTISGEHKALQLTASRGLTADFSTPDVLQADDIPVLRQVLEGEVVEIPDLEEQEDWPCRDALLQEGFRTVLVAPISVEERDVGVLSIYAEEPGHFTENDRPVAQMIGAQAGMALDRLHALSRANALGEVCRSVNSSLAESSILENLARKAVEVTGLKAAAIRMLDEEGKVLEEKTAFGLSREYLNKGPVELEKSPTDQKVLHGNVVQVSGEELLENSQYPEEVKEEGIRAVLCVPLRVKDKPIGVVRVYSSEPCEFSESDIEFLETLASQASLAIQNARLFQHLERDYEDLREAIWGWYDWGEHEPRFP